MLKMNYNILIDYKVLLELVDLQEQLILNNDNSLREMILSKKCS